VADGRLDAVGVAATRIPPATGKRPTRRDPARHWHIAHSHTVLFLDTTLPTTEVPDPGRALRLARGPVTADHVLASSAIPVAFPAVEVAAPAEHAGWYVDGGVRLNAPLRPAVALGADHLVVIAAHATRYPSQNPAEPGGQPDLADSAAMTLHSILADRVIEDLQDLRNRNHWLEQGCAPTTGARPYHHVALLEVSPEPGTLAEMASDVLHSKGRAWWRETDSLALGRLLRGVGDGPGQQELLSYMFFDDEYFEQQIELGARVARNAVRRGWQ
jgi:NTE family protein